MTWIENCVRLSFKAFGYDCLWIGCLCSDLIKNGKCWLARTSVWPICIQIRDDLSFYRVGLDPNPNAFKFLACLKCRCGRLPRALRWREIFDAKVRVNNKQRIECNWASDKGHRKHFIVLCKGLPNKEEKPKKKRGMNFARIVHLSSLAVSGRASSMLAPAKPPFEFHCSWSKRTWVIWFKVWLCLTEAEWICKLKMSFAALESNIESDTDSSASMKILSCPRACEAVQ